MKSDTNLMSINVEGSVVLAVRNRAKVLNTSSDLYATTEFMKENMASSASALPGLDLTERPGC